MLKWAIIFAILALFAGALGFSGVAGTAAALAKVLFFGFALGFCVIVIVILLMLLAAYVASR